MKQSKLWKRSLKLIQCFFFFTLWKLKMYLFLFIWIMYRSKMFWIWLITWLVSKMLSNIIVVTVPNKSCSFLHCRTQNSLFIPENMARLSETFTRAFDVMEGEKKIILSKKSFLHLPFFPSIVSSHINILQLNYLTVFVFLRSFWASSGYLRHSCEKKPPGTHAGIFQLIIRKLVCLFLFYFMRYFVVYFSFL